MGSRANYAIVGDHLELFYGHTGAITLLKDLANGPAKAIEFVRDERPVDHWLDDIWCEGAVVIDQPNRVLLLFTWHHDGVADRAARLVEIRAAWRGWEVSWAYGGIEDVVAHLGIDRLSVRTERTTPVLRPGPLEYPDSTNCLVTVRETDGTLRGYRLSTSFGEPLWAGPAMVETVTTTMPAVAGWEPLSEYDVVGPVLGLHIDLGRRELGFWTAEILKGTAEDIAACWPGWRVEFWEDRHEEHVRRCGDGFAMFPF